MEIYYVLYDLLERSYFSYVPNGRQQSILKAKKFKSLEEIEKFMDLYDENFSAYLFEIRTLLHKQP